VDRNDRNGQYGTIALPPVTGKSMPYLLREGVKFHHETLDGSGPALVLVHGWCCDMSYFAAQAEYFAGRGRRVVSLDLRGHGASDKPVGDYSIGGFADDVAWVCGELGLEKPVVIGHSMGGIIAFDLAARYRALPSAIVMLDSAVARPAASRAGSAPLLQAFSGPGYVEALRHYVDTALMIPTDDNERRARILDGMADAPQHMVVSAFRGLLDYEPDFAAGKIGVPSLYIAADEASPRCDLARLRQLLPQLQLGQTVGSGHFCQMEVPDQVNAMIDRFLSLSLAPRR